MQGLAGEDAASERVVVGDLYPILNPGGDATTKMPTLVKVAPKL
jgi:hypothetical protein